MTAIVVHFAPPTSPQPSLLTPPPSSPPTPLMSRPIPAPRSRPIPAPRSQPIPVSRNSEDGLAPYFEQQCNISDDDAPLVFELLEKGTKNFRDALVDNRGYSYNKKRKTPTGNDWQCAHRGKKFYCPATVKEREGVFTFGKQNHNHAGAPGAMTSKRIKAKVKQDALSNIFLSSGIIAEKALYTLADTVQPTESRPKVTNLSRMANRARERCRLKEPQDVSFKVATNFLPSDFLRADIESDGQCFLLFATQEQCAMLCDATIWYIDGTFKVVRPPFRQLFSIHAFIKSGDCTKQMLIQVVFEELLRVLPRRVALQTLVTDFEKATWTAIQHVVPEVTVRGCSFHWSQAVWRKVQEVGLQVPYNEKGAVHTFIQRLLALPYLPVTEIQSSFQKVVDDSPADPRVDSLVAYMERSWITNPSFPLDSCSVYNMPTRTNNDVEGWHRHLNHAANNAMPPFYVLVPLLHEEACKVPIQALMVTEGTLSRLQRKQVRERQGRLFLFWSQYSSGVISAMD